LPPFTSAPVFIFYPAKFQLNCSFNSFIPGWFHECEREVSDKYKKSWAGKDFCIIFVPSFEDGVVAQMVEQRTENPCVTGSIPVDATENPS
jgi:hypothetical protein